MTSLRLVTADTSMPEEQLTAVRNRIHKILLDVHGGRLPVSALLQLAHDYGEACERVDALPPLGLYRGEITDGTVALSRGCTWIGRIAAQPRLVAFTLLRDVFRRGGQSDPEETDGLAVTEFVRAHPYLATRDWTLPESSVRRWASQVQP